MYQPNEEIRMARPLRIEYSNACYHIINRGNRKEQIFFSDEDYLLFLEKLSEYTELYDVVIHCYCLMSNHFHLHLTTKHPNLSKFMQSFSTSFTISMNHRYNKPGHLFQGRYKAQLVESKLYNNDLSRYIHLNPVKTKNFERVPLLTLKKYLHNYKWSSFRSYIGIDRKPEWLNRSFVLSGWGKSAAEKVENYRDYVEEGLLTDNLEKIKPCKINSIIGSDSFKDKIIKKYLIKDLSDIDEREQPTLSKINAFSIEDIVDVVSTYFNLDAEQITNRKGRNSHARNLAMVLSGKFCRKNSTVSVLAKRFGLKISGFNTARYKFEVELKSDKQLQRMFNELEKILKLNKKQ